MAWSEGKVADSTRVNNSYDVSGHLVRVYRWRTVGDMVRLDSLVYDASSRVIRRIDPLNNVSQIDYDGEGHIIRTITPTHDTTGPGTAPRGCSTRRDRRGKHGQPVSGIMASGKTTVPATTPTIASCTSTFSTTSEG